MAGFLIMSQNISNPFEQYLSRQAASEVEDCGAAGAQQQRQSCPWTAAAQGAYEQGTSIIGGAVRSFYNNTLAPAAQTALEQTALQAAPVASGLFDSVTNYFGPTARDIGSSLIFGLYDGASRLVSGRSAVDNIARLGDWGVTNLHLTNDNTSRQRTRGEEFFGDLSNVATIRRLDANNRPEGPPIEFNGQLPPGNYQIDYRPAVFGCGPASPERENPPRSFLLHIPPGDQRNMPVAIFLPGVTSRSEDSRDFYTWSGMRQALEQSDQGPASDRVIGIVAVSQRHRIGDSPVACDSWNVDGAMVSAADIETHRQRTGGYDDRDYFAGLAAIIPQIAPASSANHQDWTWIGASQGGMVLHRLACDPRYPAGMFRNTVTCGSSAESGDGIMPYNLRNGNGQNVTIFDHSGDVVVLPHRGRRPQWAESLAQGALRDRGFERINTNAQEPTAQEQIYLPGVQRVPGVQGQYRVTAFGPREGSTTLRTQADFTVPLATAEAVAAQRNVMWRMERVDGTGPVLNVFDLRDAPHPIAGPQPPGEGERVRSHAVHSTGIALQNLLEDVRRRRAQARTAGDGN